MGALTLKSFPFELRGWDIEKFNGVDPTDGFATNTKIYISKKEIVQIEPSYNGTGFNFWLNDKGRQFFDSFKNKKELKKNSWNYILKFLFKILYFFDFCKNKQQQNYYFTIIVENISIEIISLLVIFLQNYSFIKIKRSEKIKLNNDLESNFQLNFANKKNLLEKSNLVMLVANNPRYEGYLLNLNLKQRLFKGNFKFFVLGSLIDLTFPVNFLGTKLNIFKNITEGNNLICQDLKSSNNSSLIFNTEIFKRNDGKNIIKMINFLNYSNKLNKIWNYNILNNLLYETGLNSIINLSHLTLKDLLQFSSFYFLNLTNNNLSNFKKIAEIKLLNCNEKYLQTNKLFIDQTNLKNDSLNFYYEKLLRNKNFNKYLYFPVKMFYENEENYINTEGFIKTSFKIIQQKETKNSWKLLRNYLKNFKKNLVLNFKDNLTIFFNSKNQSKFKHFITFNYTTSYIINFNLFVLFTNNQPIYCVNKNKYKSKKFKLFCTKIKYWLDDFFVGARDGYSQNSLTLTNCSKIQRFQKTNFF